ncbi:MAG: hypothetical protein IJ415_04550, partial [Clostridia bacterium]|nr:hypothetical protein [Clostridia bacterium]
RVYAPYKVVNVEQVNCCFMKDVLAYEINNKLYKVMKWRIYVRTGSVYTDYVLTITPFNCYWRKWGDGEFLSEKNTHEKLTQALRKIMKERYGEVYMEEGKKFYEEVRDFKIELEKNTYIAKRKKILQQADEQIDSFVL